MISVSLCCQVLGVRREGYYAWKHRQIRENHDAETVSALKQLRHQHPCYGVRSLRNELAEQLRPSYGKCYRLCKENGLLMRKKRPHSITKLNKKDVQSEDLVQRDFTANVPGTKWLGDITEVICGDGKLYLAAILDCYDGAILGYAMEPHKKADLCSTALRRAICRFGYRAGLILHSDHGSQYTSHTYRDTIAAYGGIRQSMGRTHCCYDNARMESFFATLKKELIYRLPCSRMKRSEVQYQIFLWIETYYNRLRRNTANEGNLPPLVKRMHWAKSKGLVA